MYPMSYLYRDSGTTILAVIPASFFINPGSMSFPIRFGSSFSEQYP